MADIDSGETRDEVIREVRRIKEQLAAAAEFDIHRIIDESRKKQQTSGHRVLSPPVREDA